MHHNFDDLNNLMDADLIRLVQCQDENAFTELVSRFSPRIWNAVVQNSRQTRDAEEILMDIWLAVWQNVIGLRKVESFGAWLHKIAHTACNRYYASKRNQQDEIIMSYEDLAAQIDRESEQRFQSAKLRADAREAVHQLPQKVRPIAQMYYLDLSSVKEIADEFNLPIGTVKSKLSETRKLLQKEFEIESKRSKSMTQKPEKPETEKTICKIIGVGGAGCSAVKQLINDKANDIEFYAIDTDTETLNACDELIRIQIGEKATLGQGTDGSLELGRRAAAENIDQLQSVVSDADMIFIIAGMGGGTGTAVAPVIASIARSKKILTVCLATRPFFEEGLRRIEIAKHGLYELSDEPDSAADAIILVPNPDILNRDSLIDSFSEMIQYNEHILIHSVKSILDIFTTAGEINVDFDDIQTLFRNQGTMVMGFGKATGENRAKIAAQNAIESSLFQEESVTKEPSMLVNISSPPNFTMHELDQAMCVIGEKYQDASPIFGLVYDDKLEQNDEVIVTVIASGSESQSPSTPSISTRSQGNTSKQDQETISSTDSDTVKSSNLSFYGMLFGQEHIPESVQITIDNIASIEILPD